MQDQEFSGHMVGGYGANGGTCYIIGHHTPFQQRTRAQNSHRIISQTFLYKW
jgi:hypothetical protein